MFRKIAFATLIIVPTSAFAAGAPTLADLQKGMDACKLHIHETQRIVAHRTDTFEIADDGWSHCLLIKQHYDAATKAAAEADEAQNPDLKASRDLAKRLAQPAPK
jgi:uncharacterized protein YdaU (DUF1376 family)